MGLWTAWEAAAQGRAEPGVGMQGPHWDSGAVGKTEAEQCCLPGTMWPVGAEQVLLHPQGSTQLRG